MGLLRYSPSGHASTAEGVDVFSATMLPLGTSSPTPYGGSSPVGGRDIWLPGHGPPPHFELVGLAAFLLAALTDALDGHLARRWGVKALFDGFLIRSGRAHPGTVVILLVQAGTKPGFDLRLTPIMVTLVLARSFLSPLEPFWKPKGWIG